MGGVGSDIAVDAADIALVNDDIQELPHLLWPGQADDAHHPVQHDLFHGPELRGHSSWPSPGILNPVVGALVHNAGSVLVIINSAFLLHWKKKA